MRTVARAFVVRATLTVLGVGCHDARILDPSGKLGQLSLAAVATPDAPSNASAVPTSASSITLIWQDNSINESRFEIERATAGGPFTSWGVTPTDRTTFHDNALQASTEYCYRVRALRISGSKTWASGYSNTACATTPTPPPPPPPSPPPVAATNLDAIPYSSTEVALSWSGSSLNGEDFRIERSVDGGQSWSVAGTTDYSLFFTDVGLTSERQVCYRVIAFNSTGDAAPSNTDCTIPPAAPTNLMVTQVDSVTVRMTWTDNSAVEDGYEVWANLIWGSCPPGSGSGCDAGQYGPGWTLLGVLPPNSTTFTTAPYYPPEAGVVVVAIKDGGSSGGVPRIF